MTSARLVAPRVSVRAASAAAAVASAGLTAVVYARFTAFTLLGVGLTIGFALYALLGPQAEPTAVRRRAEAYTIDDPRVPGVLTVLVLLATAGAILALSGAYYTKPLGFYAGVGLAAGLLVARIVLTDAHRTSGLLAGWLGVTTFASNQLAFPLGLNGPDAGVHVGLTRTVVETGHVVGGTIYTGFPAQHLLAATAALLTGAPVPPTYRTVGIAGMLLGLR